MKRFIICQLALLAAVCAFAQDPVVMTVAGQEVRRSEFEYSFNKNSGDSVSTDYEEIRQYADMYLNYKLKVQAAIDARLDTAESFKREFATYRDIQLRPYLIDSLYVDSVAREVYKKVEEQVGDSDLVLARHFFLQIPQDADDELIAQKQARIDSVYEALCAGAEFADMVEISEDGMTKKTEGELPWLAPGQTLPEFEAQLYALQPGEMCKPFQSSAGLHILKVVERKKLESYEEKQPDILKLLVRQGINVPAAEHKIQALIKEKGIDREAVLQEVQREAAESDPNLPLLVQEYHDGLLMYEASKQMVWDVAQVDTAGLEKYFKANKKKYVWDTPRYKGFAIQAKSQAMLDEVLGFMKKNKVKDTEKLPLLHAAYKDSVRAYRIKYGVFRQKDDAVVDYHVYNSGVDPQNKRYTVTAVQGKMQKQPKVWTDVESDVKNDYQDLKEDEWVDKLRARYSYSIDESALRTVNKH